MNTEKYIDNTNEIKKHINHDIRIERTDTRDIKTDEIVRESVSILCYTCKEIICKIPEEELIN